MSDTRIFFTFTETYYYYIICNRQTFYLTNMVSQKDFQLPKRNFHLPNGSLVGALRHPAYLIAKIHLMANICLPFFFPPPFIFAHEHAQYVFI